MEVIARLTREFSYNAWANRQALASLQAARQPPEHATDLMAHIIGSEHRWLRRLGRTSWHLPASPAFSLTECHEQLHELLRMWASYLARLSSRDLSREIAYTNSKGEELSNAVVDILGHVLFHSADCRGRIAALLGRTGAKAALTNYLEWVREGQAEKEPGSSCLTPATAVS
jgi:uncharacterized damage-inducible protein DinB